ncbi:hypothetical protein K1T71_011718 [Dendrolimus kikuchii]|uniref:Uncharacterized protein n=1 Tax=Dendrolimus kikuchii TaxID=765133 RepID=A0ACC1CLU8_9NEOP|nr:hypothetical protein K1T71_011718 [Dendrolimus kikuchii]
MFRNQYDSDVTVWSPQGRLHQVEYAMEAVKLGSATVGLKNKQYAVLIALKRAVSELSAYQKKIIPIDEHIGISISGLTADARMLSRFMRTECLNHRYSHDAPMPVGRLISLVGNKMQICTQRYDKRPLGVGLLVAGYDDQGPHIFQTCPSANYFDCRAMAIGARSQSARTYLEKHLSTFADCDLQELVAHGLRALRDTLPNELDLNTKNVSIAIVGPKSPLRIAEEEELTRFLALVEGEERRGGTATGDAGAGGAEGEAPGEGADPQPAYLTDGAMIRLTLVYLLTGAYVSALNLEYLDPTKLQTIVSASEQQEFASRLIRSHISQAVVVVDPTLFKEKKDAFFIRTLEGQLRISASSGVAALWGLNYYLKKYCKTQIAWQVRRIEIPNPLPEANELVIANDRFRYYQNVCTASYSFVWWNGQDWMNHLEWMALNGINLVLAPVAQEAAWARIYRRLGMTNEEIDEYFTGPAFLSWLRMGNVHGWGGPLPKSWHDTQQAIQEKLVDSMLRLGMIPVYPAFNGHVPKAFERIFSNATFNTVDNWNRFGSDYCCGLFLDPADPLFKSIGKMFLSEVTAGAAAAHIYTADPFNEVKIQPWSTALVRGAASAIFSTLSEFDSQAVWLLQNWMFVSDPLMWPKDRVKSFLNTVPSGRILVLDLQAEQWPQYDLYEMYFDQPFIWCMLHNFGGTLGMFGNMETINKDVYEVRSRTNSTMIGIGLTPEGINQNYVVYDLMLESAWRKEPVKDLNDWVADYAERRYGCNTTSEAWRYLLKSVYSFNGLNRVRGKYVVTRRPSFKIKPWAWYRSHDLFEAFRQFAFMDDNRCSADGFYYDLVDLTRQAMQYRAEQLYINVQNDRYSNIFVFNASINQFLDAMNDMEVILAANENFLLQPWLYKASQMGNSDAQSLYLYDLNARNQITLWGPNGEISDYACKQWDGLFHYYYIPRWAKFLSAALEAKVNNEFFDEKGVQRIVRTTVEEAFLTEPINRLPEGDAKTIAKRLYAKWSSIPDLNDLPQSVIKPDPERKTTLADVDTDSDETFDTPTVIMLHSTTPIR